MSFTADRKERVASLVGVALLHLLLGWAMLMSLAPNIVRQVEERLRVFSLAEAPPPPPPPQATPEPPAPTMPRPEPAAAPRAPEAAAAPPARRADPSPVVAPPRKIPAEVSPPVAAGIVPASGGEVGRIDGAPDWQGSGAGAAGNGAGSGSAGTGTGGGGTGGAGRGEPATRAKIRSGRIAPADYPRAAGGDQGIVEVELAVSSAGSVNSCKVTLSSGNDVLDKTTCRLIRERFRFTPARDADGRAVADVKGWRQRWWLD